MKNFFFTIALLASCGSFSMAQHMRFGVKVGAIASKESKSGLMQSEVELKFGLGGYVAGFAEISFKSKADKFKLQLEALYCKTNFASTSRYDSTFIQKRTVGVQSICVPIVAKYFVTPRISVFAGPMAIFNLDANVTNRIGNGALKTDFGDELNTFQMGIMAGANYYVWKGLFLEARYHAVLPNLTRPDYGSFTFYYRTINNVSLGLGFKFK